MATKCYLLNGTEKRSGSYGIMSARSMGDPSLPGPAIGKSGRHHVCNQYVLPLDLLLFGKRHTLGFGYASFLL